jgi:hypothetical protein
MSADTAQWSVYGAGTLGDPVALAAVAAAVRGTHDANVEPPGRLQYGAWDEVVDGGCHGVVVVQGGVYVSAA